MHRSTRTARTLLAPLLVAVAGATFCQAQAVRICPLGDSITESYVGQPSYRYHLDRMLRDGGHDFDLVGTNTGVAFGPARYEDFDQDHEGHSGWRADQIQLEIGGWAQQTNPDIYLVHLGTNDLNQRQSTESTLSDIEHCIESVRVHRPHAAFVLAQIIPMQHRDVAPYNAGLVTLAAALDRPYARVVTADLNAGFQTATMRWIDGVHPTELGELWIAQRFFAALEPLLSARAGSYESIGAGCGGADGGSAPRLDRVDGVVATIGSEFASSVDSLPATASQVFGILGLFRFDASSGGSLDLSAIGMPGCSLHVQPALATQLPGEGESRAWTLHIPDAIELVGVTIYQQAAVVDPLANALGMVLSNATGALIAAR